MVNCLNIKHGVAKRAHARTDSHEMATLNATKMLLLTNQPKLITLSVTLTLQNIGVYCSLLSHTV